MEPSREQLEHLVNHIREVFFVSTPEPVRVTYVSPAYEEIWGRPREEVYRRPAAWIESIHPEDRERAIDVFTASQRGEPTRMEYRIVRPDGSTRWISNRTFPVHDSAGKFTEVVGVAEDITDYKRVEQTLRESLEQTQQVQEQLAIDVPERTQAEARLRALNDIMAAAAGAADLRTFLGTLLDRALTVLEGERGGIWLGTNPDRHVTRNMAPELSTEVVATASAAGLDFTRVVAVEDWDTLTGPTAEALRPVLQRAGAAGASLTGPILLGGRMIGGFAIATSRPRRWSSQEIQLVEAIGKQVGAVAERLRLLDEVRVHAHNMEALHSVGVALRGVDRLDDVYAIIVEQAMALLHGDHAALVLIEPDDVNFRCACVRGIATIPQGAVFPVAGSLSGMAIHQGGVFLTPDLSAEPPSVAGASPGSGLMGPCISVPMREGDRVIGALIIARQRGAQYGPFTPQAVGVVTTLADLASHAIHRTQLAHQIAQELAHVRTLHESAQRMVETLDLQRLADEAVALCVGALGVTFAWTAKFDDSGVPRGLACFPANTDIPVSVPAGWAGSEIETRVKERFATGDPFVVPDFNATAAPPVPWMPALRALGLQTVAALPLAGRNGLFGLLALYSDRAGFFTPERVAFFRAYTHQLGAFLENARLYHETVHRSAQLQALREIDQAITGSLDLGLSLNVVLASTMAQLQADAACVLLFNPHLQVLEYAAEHGFRTAVLRNMRAYDTTLAGWAHALELRDKETEGHTQRVAETAVRLATKLGIPDTELVHIRRGALLHDIGKMAISDTLLLKPGPLTSEERATMELHPEHAYHLLAPIQFLRQALDIPYCHHEKWDGTGYPRGLKGMDIPLAARIFAVVDVWDALTSKRPYRAAWSTERARKHIAERAGTHFDPDIVTAFLEMLEEHEAPARGHRTGRH
ncbi:MAG TPA: HD domain-containing phosphohydrolase [bacterium]|nr:HD domain-containing phosphohydrolase [bacterium]